MASFTIGEVYRQGWALTKPNFLKIWGYLLLMGAISWGFSAAGSFMGEGGKALMGFLGYIVSLILSLGYTRVLLKLVKGENPGLEDMFWFEGKAIVAYFIGSILYSFIVLGGIILLIIPGIIWGVGFGMYSYAIVDRGMDAEKSLRYSWRIMKGNKFKYMVLSLVVGLMNLGAALLLIIPLLITVPLSVMIMVVTYRKLAWVETGA